MIAKWHVHVYWYSIGIMVLFLIFLFLPDKTTVSKAQPDNYNRQMKSISDDNLKAKSATDRSQIARRYNNLQKQKQMKSENVVFNLVPLKVILLVTMAIFTYMVFHYFRQRFHPTAADEA